MGVLRIGLPSWNTFISSLLEHDKLLWAIDQIKTYKITHNLCKSNSKAIRLLVVKKEIAQRKNMFLLWPISSLTQRQPICTRSVKQSRIFQPAGMDNADTHETEPELYLTEALTGRSVTNRCCVVTGASSDPILVLL